MATQRARRCGDPGLENLSRDWHVNGRGTGPGFRFCPGKATWYEEAAELFSQCRVALASGILPREGSLEDQSDAFAEVFPLFVGRWQEKTYAKVWGDVNDYVIPLLKKILGGKKK